MKKINLILILVLMLFLISACDNNKEVVTVSEKNHGFIEKCTNSYQFDLNLLFRSIDSNDNAIWSSSNRKVATVNNNGTVTCIGMGETVITRTTDNNMIDKVTVYVGLCDPSLFNVNNYDFLRVRILSNEEYNQYMRDYYDSPEENFEYQDAWLDNFEYKLVYAEVMECYNNIQSRHYSVGKIYSLAMPRNLYNIYKDYDQIVLYAYRGRIETLDYRGELVESNVDICISDINIYSRIYSNGLAIKNNEVYISELLELGVAVNNSILFEVIYEYSTIEHELIIKDGTTIEELTEMFNYMVNIKCN